MYRIERLGICEQHRIYNLQNWRRISLGIVLVLSTKEYFGIVRIGSVNTCVHFAALPTATAVVHMTRGRKYLINGSLLSSCCRLENCTYVLLRIVYAITGLLIALLERHALFRIADLFQQWLPEDKHHLHGTRFDSECNGRCPSQLCLTAESWIVLQTRPLALTYFHEAVQRDPEWQPKYRSGPKVAVNSLQVP